MKQSAKFGWVLGITCFMATLILSLTYEITRTRIESRSESEEASALKKIMPDADDFRKNSVSGIEYFEATKNGQTVGYCVRAVGNGYGGYIKMIFGIDRSGIIKGLEILEQSETPGLGSKIVEIDRKSVV